MKTIERNGRQIKTNLGKGDYPFCDGNDKATMTMHLRRDYRESDTEMFERLARYGYTRITFYRTTTRVRGIYSLLAFCK